MRTSPTRLPAPLNAVVCELVLMAAPERRTVPGRCTRPGCSCSGWCARFPRGRGRPEHTRRTATRRSTRSPALLHRTPTGRSRHA
ncbi:hypothetical protein PWG71_19330 [Nocardiopsis sp. N85]|uniref:hypothetical protein n=1 Tax=Nocardiopsis sp. N85 TaxID=3029400 RepID=UPI00237F82D9|nr:hypothetical protein [Nocardiopsis sp. N85]MDE3723548.1 hypothetical protein [Nocardiopsis sp. N85]